MAPQQTPVPPVPRRTFLAYGFLALVVVAAIIYGNTLHIPLYLDDQWHLVNNPAARDIGTALRRIFTPRGVTIFTFACNYVFSNGNLFTYHLVNIFIHIAAGGLSLVILTRIFPERLWLALFGALLFVLHPLQTQAVNYTVQRMTILSAFFSLLALYLFIRGREALAAGIAFRDLRHLSWYLGALAAGGLAFFSKENAVVLPLLLLLFEKSFPAKPEQGWRPLLNYLAPFVLIPVVAAVMYYAAPLLTAQNLVNNAKLESLEGNTPFHYLLTQFSVLWLYIRLLFIPYGQALEYSYPLTNVLGFKAIVGALGLAGLFGLACYWRRKRPVFAFGILWFFIALAVESSIIPLDPVYEHRLYLPMLGFAAVAAALLEQLRGVRVQLAVAGLVIVTLALLTLQRNQLWNDPIAFYRDNLVQWPQSERAHVALGMKLIKAGDMAEGEALIKRGLELSPRMPSGYFALKDAYLAAGRIDAAIDILKTAIRFRPDYAAYYNDLAFLYSQKGNLELSISLLKKSIELDPGIAAAYFNLAQMQMVLGDMAETEVLVRKSLQLDPGNADAHELLANILSAQERYVEAAQESDLASQLRISKPK